jgi:hypothetical protein
MKFLTLSMWPLEKTAEVSAASDKAWAKLPKERREGSNYILMCHPAGLDVPPNTMVSIGISEEMSAEEIAASTYPFTLAGGSIQIIPLLEVLMGSGVKADKKYRG